MGTVFQLKTLLLIWISAVALIALTVSTALAAQGQITDVNPSGKDISHARAASGDLGLSHKLGAESGDQCPLKQLGGY